MEKSEMTIEQRRGIISLLPKGSKDLKCIKNWHPISVLNVDYKIIAKVLANRIKPVLSEIISRDQVAYVQDRVIGENIRTVKDVIDYCNANGIEGYMLMVDFEKAFDSLDRGFLIHALKAFGFGEKFQYYVKILYQNISSVVINNGNTTKSFPILRGIRQGCPVLAYLFILCVELLAEKIRKCEYVKGIKIYKHWYKTLQFADDTVLFLKDKVDLANVIEILIMDLQNVVV